jgi:class 3 adenylate cyclase
MPEERKLATILFADVTGSTELGEQLDPEQLRAILRRFFEVMADVITDWGGTVEKYVGDAILAVFGVPTAREDDPARALQAALEMQRRLAHLNDEFTERHAVSLAIRIGVNTGEVIAPTGSTPDAQFLVAGDAVNVAARLEQAAEPGTIAVGERTWQFTRGQFHFGSPVALDLRGKSGAIAARQLLGALAPSEIAERPIQAPMIGRDVELATLRGLFSETIDRREPALALIYGTAGIGKSRLTREFLAAAGSGGAGLQVLRGRCLAAGQGITFWALGEILRSCVGIGFDEPGDVAGQRLREGVSRVLEPLDLSDDDIQRATSALAATAGLALTEDPLDRLSPEAMDEEMSRAWPMFASGLASAAPTVILIEDLHWADDRLVEMVGRTVARAHGPLLLLATARPEFAEAHPEFAAASESSTVISLRPLTERQGQDLVDGLLTHADLPERLRADILERADGNPFFVEELIAGLVDQGVLIREDGDWRVQAGDGALALPDSVHAVLAARIDALPATEKQVLQEAAVVGRNFWPEPIRGQLADVDVAGALRALERRGLLVQRPTSSLAGQAEYLFRHQLVHDVAYLSVPKSRRARAHAALAAWIEQLAGERFDEFGELIAHHSRLAVTGEGADLAWADDPAAREQVRRRAFEVLLRAGAAARRRFALSAAVEMHHQAEALAISDQERLAALEALGDDHAAYYHGDDAMPAYQAASDLAQMVGERTAVARLAAKANRIGLRYGAFRHGPPVDVMADLVRSGLDAAEDPATRAALLVAYANLGRVYLGSGMGRLLDVDREDPVPTDQRRAAAEEALDIGHRLGDAELVFKATDALAEISWLAGDFAAYHATAARILELEPTLSGKEERAILLTWSAQARHQAGDHSGALSIARRALEISRELSPHEMMHASYQVMASAYSAGDWGVVLERFEEHRAAAAQEPNVTCSMVHGGPVLGAIVLTERGDRAEAQRLVPLPAVTPRVSAFVFAALAGRYAIALGDPGAVGELTPHLLTTVRRRAMHGGLPELVDLLAATADWDRLAEITPRLRGYVPGIAPLGAYLDRAEALRLAAAGDTAGAQQLLASAIEGFDRWSMPFEAARSRELLAEHGGPDRSTLLAQAIEGYRQVGARPHLERVESQLVAT